MQSEQEISKFVISTLRETKEFVIDQAPEVIQQVLGFKEAQAVTGMIISILLISFAGMIYRTGVKKVKEGRSWDCMPHIIMPGSIVFLVGVLFLGINLMAFIHVHFYPKAYLLSKFL